MSYPYPPGRPRGRFGSRGRPWADSGVPGPTALDRFVERFRHRWETEPQYRTTVSAGCGASALLALCVVVALAATVASAAFGGTGSTGAGPLGNSLGGGVIAGQPQFPTNTVPAWAPGQLPNAVVAPTSATSAPTQKSPTPTPTDTGDATPSSTPGGLPTTCNGQVGPDTWAFDKCPELAGQGGSLTVKAPGWANTPIKIIVNFGSCANGANCTVSFTANANHLDAQATITVNFSVPTAAANNSAPMSGLIQVSNGGPSFSYQAAPVQ